MSLLVTVSLDRKVPIYLTGEEVRVEVCVKNQRKGRESLAWGSVQLTCDRTFGRRKSESGAQTAFAPSASNVYSSLPAVIFCELELIGGESKTFECSIRLPHHGLPPSFKGHYLRYFNRVTVGVARIRSTLRLLQVPIRVVTSVGAANGPTPSVHPFLAQTRSEPTIDQLVTAAVDTMTAPKKPILFALTCEMGKIASLTLFKKVFRMGEDVIGHMSFEGAAVSTLHMIASLETLESLSEEVTGNTLNEPHVTSVCTEERECMAVVDSHFRLPLPMTSSPSFHTDILHHKWRLRVDLTISGIVEMEESADDPSLFQQPRKCSNVNRVSWSTDIFVVPSTPHNLSLTDESLYSRVSTCI